MKSCPNRYAISAVFLVVIATFVAHVSAAKEEEPRTDEFGAYHKHLQDRDYVAARNALEAVVLRDPYNKKARVLMAEMYKRLAEDSRREVVFVCKFFDQPGEATSIKADSLRFLRMAVKSKKREPEPPGNTVVGAVAVSDGDILLVRPIVVAEGDGGRQKFSCQLNGATVTGTSKKGMFDAVQQAIGDRSVRRD